MTSQRSRSNRKNNATPPGDAPHQQQPQQQRPPESTSEPRTKSNPPERIGDILRKLRERRGDDLDQIAEYLCIRPAFLHALENNRYDELPADAYVIGFLRSYANLLGYDGREAIDRYRREMAGQRKKPVLTMPVPVSEARSPSVAVMLGAAATALVVYALWYGLSTPNRAAVNTPPPLPVLPGTMTEGAAGDNALMPALIVPPAPAETPASDVATPNSPAPEATAGIQLPAAAPEAVPMPAPASAATAPADAGAPIPITPVTAEPAPAVPDPGGHIAIRAEKESWVLITDSKFQTVLDRVLKAGDTYKVPDTEGLRLTTGNAGAITLMLDGVDLKDFAGNSRVLRDFALDKVRPKKPKPAPAAEKPAPAAQPAPPPAEPEE